MSIEDLEAELKKLQAERDRQYWIFTRTARGKPVSPALCRQIADLEEKIRKKRIRKNIK